MATLTFNSIEDTRAEMLVLVEALTTWLAEQPDQPTRGGQASFSYGADGRLNAVVVEMAPASELE